MLSPRGNAEARNHGRRRPRRVRVRSESVPTSGSLTASQIRPARKIAPTVAGAISSTSVANFNRYIEMSAAPENSPRTGAL